MSANDDNTNAQQPQLSNEDKLKISRGWLGATTLDGDLIPNNKKRKKLKRWFDRCARKHIEDAQPGELCYGFQSDGTLLLGKRDKADTTNMRHPFLIVKKNGQIEIQINNKTNYNITEMSYDTFYNSYKDISGKNAFLSFFEDAWDGFMSITQLPRQRISRNDNKAKSVGGHVANIATRVFSPVIAAAVGVCAGALAACAGVKALKDKLIPTEEELRQERQKTQDDYMNRFDNESNKEDIKLYKDGVTRILRNDISDKEKRRMLDKQVAWYKDHIFPKINLDNINVSNLQQSK